MSTAHDHISEVSSVKAELMDQSTTPLPSVTCAPIVLEQFLTGESEIVVGKALKIIIDSLNRDDSQLESFVSRGILTTVIGRLAKVNSVQVSLSKLLLEALFGFSNYVKGRESIIIHGGIQRVISLMRHQNHVTVNSCCCIMSNVLHCGKAAVKLAIEAGAVATFTWHLMRTELPMMTLALVVDCLNYLLADNSANQTCFLAAGGVPRLVQLLSMNLSNPVLSAISQLVVTLTLFNEYKDHLVPCSAFSVLAVYINNPHTNLRLRCGQAMRNLSNEISEREVKLSHEVVSSLVSGLPDAEPFGELCRVEALYNITANSPHNKHLVLVAGGLAKLVGTLRRALDKGWADQLFASVCALSHLTSGNPLASQARHQLSSEIALILKCLLHRPLDLPYVAAVVGLIQKLSSVKEAQPAIVQFMPRLLGMYRFIAFRMTSIDFYSMDGCNFLEDIIRYCLVLFFHLAKEGNVDPAFTGKSMANTYIMHLKSKSKGVVLATLNLINELMRSVDFRMLAVELKFHESLSLLIDVFGGNIASLAMSLRLKLMNLSESPSS